MTCLSVNVNKIALLRNSRDIGIPSVTGAAHICIQAGAKGITVHPRPDQRHIRPGDVYSLAEMLTVELNIEGNPFAEPEGGYPGFMELVQRVKPAQCTLVPDDPNQLTSDHGWDLAKDGEKVRPKIDQLKALGIRVSMFMDPAPEQMELAAKVGADRVELYTEPYARAFEADQADLAVEQYAAAATAAQQLGMGVNAGHDLNLENLATFVSGVPNVLEVSIGHALICEALGMGLSDTVEAYVNILKGLKS